MKTKIFTSILILSVFSVFAGESYGNPNQSPVAVLTAEPNYADVNETVTLDGTAALTTRTAVLPRTNGTGPTMAHMITTSFPATIRMVRSTAKPHTYTKAEPILQS